VGHHHADNGNAFIQHRDEMGKLGAHVPTIEGWPRSGAGQTPSACKMASGVAGAIKAAAAAGPAALATASRRA
jgi:hypothetical protein